MRSQCKTGNAENGDSENGDCPQRANQPRKGLSLFSELTKKIPFEIALLLLALALRLWHLGKQSLWMDEAFSVWLASHSLHQMLQIIAIDAHPPLFYALLHFWMKFGKSEAFLRLPFALISAFNAILVYRLGLQCFNRKTAIVASLFWAVSFPILDAETQVRMYGMATALSLLATLLFLDAFRAATLSRWIPYVLVAGFCLYTHYYTAFILAAHLLFLTFHKRWREFTWLSLALTAVFAPWNRTFFNQLFGRLHFPRLGLLIKRTEFYIPSQLFGIDNFLANRKENFAVSIGIFLSVLLVMALLFKQKKQKTYLTILILVFSLIIPLYLSVTNLLNLFSTRYVILFAAYFYLFFFYGLLKLPRTVVVPIFAALLFINLSSWQFFTTKPACERQNWREISAFLRQHLKPNDNLFLNNQMMLFPFWYYLPHHFELIPFPKDRILKVVPNPRLKNSWIAVDDDTTESMLNQYARSSHRAWVILFLDWIFDPGTGLRNCFSRHQRLLWHGQYRSFQQSTPIDVFLFKRLENAK